MIEKLLPVNYTCLVEYIEIIWLWQELLLHYISATQFNVKQLFAL